jgi:hypothetical protein
MNKGRGSPACGPGAKSYLVCLPAVTTQPTTGKVASTRHHSITHELWPITATQAAVSWPYCYLGPASRDQDDSVENEIDDVGRSQWTTADGEPDPSHPDEHHRRQPKPTIASRSVTSAMIPSTRPVRWWASCSCRAPTSRNLMVATWSRFSPDGFASQIGHR